MGIISLTDAMQRARISQPVTFEPFELQKWQSTKNGSTLHQKPILHYQKNQLDSSYHSRTMVKMRLLL